MKTLRVRKDDKDRNSKKLAHTGLVTDCKTMSDFEKADYLDFLGR